MRVMLIKCNMCDKTCPFSLGAGPVYNQLPSSWMTLLPSDGAKDDQHFCSQGCLAKSLGVQPQEPQLQLPTSKARRFMLVDGETADEFEGVKFGSGHVSIDTDLTPTHYATHYSSWEAFKANNSGSGVTWIDEEVSDAS